MYEDRRGKYKHNYGVRKLSKLSHARTRYCFRFTFLITRSQVGFLIPKINLHPWQLLATSHAVSVSLRKRGPTFAYGKVIEGAIRKSNFQGMEKAKEVQLQGRVIRAIRESFRTGWSVP